MPSRPSGPAIGRVLLALVLSGAALAAQAPVRAVLANGHTNWVPRATTDSGLVVQALNTGITPAQLANSILSGTGVTISNVTYSGTGVSAGTFTTTSPGILGFPSGIVLSSGNVGSVVGPNVSDSTSTDNGLGGDPQLQALIPNHVVHDACVLQFDFTTTALAPGQTGAVNFNFVFSSEEYNEWVNTAYNDVFGFFLNGQNIALLQNLVTPVQIDTVNGGNPYGPPPSGVNWNQYRNNDLNDGGGLIDTEMDGLTVTLTAHGNITGPGPHHIKLGIADAGDSIYDSNVFIQGASLSATPGPSFIAPTPTAAVNVQAQQPVSFEVRGVANNGTAAAAVTMTLTSATFDAGFTGNPVPVAAPGSNAPPLPQSGQPVSTVVTWTPNATAVGVWALTYHLVDNLGLTADRTVQVNVIPVTLSGPVCVAPTPATDVEAIIGFSTGWEVAAVTNNGLPGAWVRIDSVSVEYDANFLGNSIPVANPAGHWPTLPLVGQPASTGAYWTPAVTDVGQWDFDYHLIDNVGQTYDCSITVMVRDAALLIGLNPAYAPFLPGSNDILRVEPILFYPIGVNDQPEIIVPNAPALFGLDVWCQVILFNAGVYPADPLKTSPAVRFKIEVSNLTVGPGSGLDLVGTGIAQLGESLPYDFSILGP